MCQSAASKGEKSLWTIYNCPILENWMFCSERLSSSFCYWILSQIPSAQSWLSQKPQTLMPRCAVPTSQAVSFCSPHSGYSSLLPELGMHPVFLIKHQNKMWCLHVVEMAAWAAGFGSVLHASDKNKKIPTQCKGRAHHVVKVSGYGQDRAISHTYRSVLIYSK